MRVNPKIWLVMTFVLLHTAFIAAATERHVPSQYSTIQAAIDVASSGDIILVEPGTYFENLNFRGKAISLQSISGPSLTTIKGNGGKVVTMGGPSAEIVGFTITGGKADYGAGIEVSGSNSVIRENIFEGNIQTPGGYGAAIGGNSASPIIEKNIFCNNTSDNQWLSGVVSFINSSSPVIRNNIFANNNSNAIVLTLPSGNKPIVTNNTIVNNRIGIRVDTRANQKKQVFQNNILVANQNGLRIENGWEPYYPTWEYNLVFGNNDDYVGIKDQTGIAGNINADPIFVDANNGDYHLLPDSRCINAGDPNFIAESNETDIDGESRVMLGRVDIGADEWPGPWMLYVDSDAKGANNGSSWKDAYNYLQDALADAKSSAKPVEIRVAPGIYKPDQGTGITPSDRMASFQLINGVTIKGGYAGFGEPDPDARDIALYKTILSGDIGTLSDRSDNCYHVFYHPEGLNLDTTAILNGFTVTGGNANSRSLPYSFGGGMYNYKSSPTVKDCTFTDNQAWPWYGGGMYNYKSSPKVTSCTFTDNSTPAGEGGGMYNSYGSPMVKSCIFIANTSRYEGGGMNNSYDSNPMVINCTFIANSIQRYGGGMYNLYSSPTVKGCTFCGNSARDGGGMYNDRSYTIVEGCTFNNNMVTFGEGGGMFNWMGSPNIKGCTFVNNSAKSGGGMYNQSNSIVTNCILWADAPSEIDGDTPIVTYSDIQGGWTGTGNINADPLFVNPDSNDFHLSPDSPCINAGDPNFVAEPNETDMDGEARVMFERIDMGADEFNPIRLGIVNKKRVSRTEFAYDCNATFTNLWPFAVKNVELQMMQVSENMTIIEPNVTFGDIQFNARQSITSIDTCTFQVDRSKAIEPDKIVWKVKCQRADTGMPIELTCAGTLADDGQTGLEELAALAGQWLWVGEASSIPEDITGDGIVNLRDFAELAANPQ